MPARAPAAPPASPAAPGGYAEHAPSAALRPYVQCFWTRETGEPGPAMPPAPAAHRVLPDGCIDIVLGFAADRGGVPHSVEAVGTMTRALVVHAVPRASFVGVRFRPAKSVGFLGLPASELTDLSVPLDHLWSDAPAVGEAFAGAADSATRVGVLDRVLRARLDRGVLAEHRDVDEAVRRIVAAGGSLGITRLAPALGVTRQHLARRFADFVGLSPKTFARVVRLRRLIAEARAARDGTGPGWSALAVEVGYYDQAHLTDEFRELTGLTPAAWWKTQGGA